MISEIDTSSVVDETESTKVTTKSQMAECSTELMRRPETTDGRWIPAGMQGCPAGVTLMNVGCDCDDQAGQQHEPADPDMAEPDHAALGTKWYQIRQVEAPCDDVHVLRLTPLPNCHKVTFCNKMTKKSVVDFVAI